MAPPRIDLRGSFQRQVCAYGGMYVMRSQGRARLPFLLSKEPCTPLFPGQTGQGSSRVVAGAGAPHHLVDIRLTVPRSGGVAVAPAVVAILVIPGMGCRLDAAVISGCAGLAPSNVVSAVSTASTRVSNWSKPGATAGHRSSVLPQYSIPTVTPVIVNRHSAAARTLIPRITPATSTRATWATTEVASDVIRRAGVKQSMSTMGRPCIPRSTAASITRATVTATEVASGRNNVLRCAGTKGTAATRGRLHNPVTPGPWLGLTQGACQRPTGGVMPTGSVMCPFGTPRGVWHWYCGGANVVVVHSLHVLVVGRVQGRRRRGLPWHE